MWWYRLLVRNHLTFRAGTDIGQEHSEKYKKKDVWIYKVSWKLSKMYWFRAWSNSKYRWGTLVLEYSKN